MRDAMTDVVVLVPGFGGSTLERDGRTVWGGSGDGPAGAAALLAGGPAAMDALRLAGDDPARAELADGVRATGVVHGAHLLPGVWKIDGYARIPALLGRLFDVQPGANYVEFAYDWRRDVRASARQLARSVEGWLEAWRARSGHGEAKVVLLAHSLGALVAQHFLEALDGWPSARALITFGAPFRGAPIALGALSGSGVPQPLHDAGLVELLRSFTALYQLLPAYPAVACDDDETLRRVGDVTLPGVDAARAALAAELHAEIDAARARHAHNAAYRAGAYRLVPIVGAAQSTPQSARVADHALTLLRSYQHRDLSGDGIVPRLAAQPTDAGDLPATLLTSMRHAELQNDDRALSYVLGVFMSLYMGAGPVAPPVRTRVGLDLVLDDLLAAGAPVTVRVHPESADAGELTAALENAATGETLATVPLETGAERWRHAELPAQQPGVYRVRVTGNNEVQPVADLFEVM